MAKINIEFIENINYERNEIEDTCLITQLMQYIVNIGLRELDSETSYNNIYGEVYEQIA